MNTAEKLRFIADRIEDEKEFLWFNSTYKFINGELSHLNYDEKSWNKSFYKIQAILDSNEKDLKLKPQWSFTDDEKIILRNMSEEFKWIARDKNNQIMIYSKEPDKESNKDCWFNYQESYKIEELVAFEHLFTSVKWSDEEACEFRRYI